MPKTTDGFKDDFEVSSYDDLLWSASSGIYVWTEGLRSAVFKSGKYNVVNNYRGITILPIMEKIFELAAYRRLTFVNEAMGQIDNYNGGFTNGRRTSDNMFILLGLIQRQLIIGEPLNVCFVDFSKAFDLVNRHILFFKIMKGGWSGRVKICTPKFASE